MLDHSIPYYDLTMVLSSLHNIPDYPLPECFGIRRYLPGDEFYWSVIEHSAGQFERVEDALNGFCCAFPDRASLSERMLFLTDGDVPFATATAWFGVDGPNGRIGRLHWIAIDEAHQGKRLSRPLVALALQRMRALGHTEAYLTTQTESWVAIKTYARFGFMPVIDDSSREGWRIVSEKAGLDLAAHTR